jgi:hypothetical protein
MVGVTQMMVLWVFTPNIVMGLCEHFEGRAASISGSLNFVQMVVEVIRRRKCVLNVGLGPIRALKGRDGTGLAPSSSHLSLAW